MSKNYLHYNIITVAELQLLSSNENNLMIVVHHNIRSCIERSQCLEGWGPLLYGMGHSPWSTVGEVLR